MNMEKFLFSQNPEISYCIADSGLFIPDKEIHLIVTSPPYFNYKNYGIEYCIGAEKKIRGLFT